MTTTSRLISVTREHTGDRQTDAIWAKMREIAERVNELSGGDSESNAFLDGTLLHKEGSAADYSGIVVPSGNIKVVEHGLGRVPRGILPVYKGVETLSAANGLVAIIGNVTEDPAQFFTAFELTSSSDATLFFWVF